MDVMNEVKASIVRRGVALYIDNVLMVILAVVVTMSLFILNVNSSGPIIFGLLCVILLFICKDCMNGVSVGRWFMGIAVRDSKNSSIIPNKKRLIGRNLFIIIWPIEFLVLVFGPRKRMRCGDIVTDTDVVVVRKKVALIKRITIGVASCAVLIMLLLVGVTHIIKHSDAYIASVNYIEQNKEIQAITNGIQDYGWFPEGKIYIANGRSEADLRIKVIGMRKDVLVRVQLAKMADSDWIIKNFTYKEE